MTSTATSTAPPTNPLEAGSRRWLLRSLALLLIIVGIHLFITWRLDVFGILRDTHGRQLSTSHHERKAKWLLNHNYVPQNFDALVVGPSASVDWKMQDLTGYHFYNESLEGGAANEERMLVEEALKKGHYKVAIVGLYPHTTQVHYFWDGLDQANLGEVFGSLNSFMLESDYLKLHLLHRTPIFFPNGSHVMPVGHPQIPNPGDPHTDVSQLPQAVEDYRATVQELLDHHIKVVYVVYPLYLPSYNYEREGWKQYMDNVRRTMPAAPILDFNTPEYDFITKDPANYIDLIHMSEKGSEIFTPILNTKLHEVLKDQ